MHISAGIRLIVSLAGAGMLAAAEQPADPCADKPIREIISCLEAKASQNPERGKTAILLPQYCGALTQWKKFAAGQRDSDKTVADRLVTTPLATACLHQEYLRLADTLARQRRFGEALSVYEKVPETAFPDLANRARYGRILSAERKNAFVSPPVAVQELERTGRFEEAYQWLGNAAAESEPHQKNLAAWLAARSASRTLEQRSEHEAALKVWSDLIAKLDPVRDSFLYQAAEAEVARLKPLARADADLEAESFIATGDLQMKRGQFSAAVAPYEKVGQNRANVSPKLAQEAARKAADARIRAAKEPTFRGTWMAFQASLPNTLVTLIGWMPYILCYAGTLGLLLPIKWLRPAKKEILLSMQDLTGMANDQNNANLTELMRREMELPGPKVDELHIDMTSELDGSSMGQLGLRAALSAVGTAFQPGTQVSFGPLSINPMQIVNLLRPLFRPRYSRELAGSVSAFASQTVCVVIQNNPKTGTPLRWETIVSGAPGDSAKCQAVRDTAMKILIAIDTKTREITGNWRSMSRLRAGIEYMRQASNDPAGRRALWEQARSCFQEAVLEDPGNWLGRFNLASVLRKLGLNGLAAEQFAELESSPHLPAAHKPVVKYNRAAALQKSDDERLTQEAVEILTDILNQSGIPALLRRFAESGRLAALADGLARWKRRLERTGVDPTELKEFRDKVQACLVEGEDVLDKVEKSVAAENGRDGSENNVVLAVILNALGQLQSFAGDFVSARARYRRSLTLLPTFLDPALNLAELYCERKEALDPNWATRAQRLLLDAQAADACNARCLVLLGRLYAGPVFGRVEDAKKLLTQALPAPNAGLHLGRILFEEGNRADAIAPLVSCVTQDSELGEGQLLLTRCALELPDGDRRKRELLLRCKGWLRHMVAGYALPRFSGEAERLLAEVETVIKTYSEPRAA